MKSKENKMINEYLLNNPPQLGEYGYYDKMAKKFGLTKETMRKRCRKLGLNNIRITNQINKIYNENKKDNLLKVLLKNGTHSVEELSNKTGLLPIKVREKIEELKLGKYNVVHKNHKYELSNQVAIGNEKQLNIENWKGDKVRFGFVADTHLGSKFERMDALNALYNIFADEGIDTVYHGGNIIDGEHRFNKYEIHTYGISPQVEYCVNAYPKREGVTTYFVTGDDHEGWYIQRERVNIGRYIEMEAKQSGRDDLIYIGHLEADINLCGDEPDKGESWMRVMHGGGGTSYALSYTPQKIVESYQGGEKPNILLLGHYHKIDYCFPREVHVIQMGCTQDQTIFMRKRKIQAHIGGGILKVRRAPDGTINRVNVEFITFFDKGFYVGKDKYWK